MKDGYAGRFKLNTLNLVTTSGFVMDLSKITINIKIKESIFDNTLHGELDLIETTDLITHGPIIGQERLYLSLGTPLSDSRVDKEALIEYIDVPLIVYSAVSVQTGQNNAVSGIKLLFVSDNAFRNMRTRLSQSFKGTTSDIVSDILQKNLKVKSPIQIEPTADNIHYISPNVRPYVVIDSLSKRALNSKNNCNHLFYETTKGLRFKSVDNMFSRPIDFIYEEGSGERLTFESYVDQKGLYQHIESYNIYDFRDMMSAFKHGYFASKLMLHDLYNKKVTERSLSFSDVSGELMPFSLTTDEDGNDLTSYEDSIVYSQLYNSGKTVEKAEGDKYINNMLQRKMKMLHLQRSFAIAMTAKGYSYLEAGMKVDISLRKRSTMIEQDNNEMYDGEYVIGTLSHNFFFTDMQYISEMTCYKINGNKELPFINIDDEGSAGSIETVDINQT